MPPITPPTNELLVRAATAVVSHGGKGALMADICATTGKSRATVYRQLKAVAVRPLRKQRSDAGETSLTRDEAKLISALVLTGIRKNGKRLYTVGQAVETLRANGEIRAEFLDAETGELRPLSVSAIARGLRVYGMHPDQLLVPPPARELRSLHPNHVWQIDASLCVLYYLNTTNPAETGLQVMEAKKFNKNKPKNLKSVERFRVWSYEVTDHNSGCIFVFYVRDGESAANIAEAFIRAIQQRHHNGEALPFHGVPYILMMDMGSANTSGLFKNLLRRLGVTPIAHAPENARATGQIECARNIIERNFESGLSLKPVRDLDELNARGGRWSNWFNATQINSRHGKPRFSQWQTIEPGQLRIAPSVEMCRLLLTHTPESRKVENLRVKFGGEQYYVGDVPNVMEGEKLQITYSPYQQDSVLVVLGTDENGVEQHQVAPLVRKGDDGFSLGEHSNVIGEDYRAHPKTLADRNREEVELLTMGAATLEAAAAARKAKALPFGGRIDPEAHITGAKLPTFLPRQGQAPDIGAVSQKAAIKVLNHFEAARALVGLGVAMSPELIATLKSLHADGVPEDQLEGLAARLTVRAGLRVVAGGSK